MKFWLENYESARVGEVDLPEVRHYGEAPQNIFWQGRLFYLQASNGGGYHESHRPRLVRESEIRITCKGWP